MARTAARMDDGEGSERTCAVTRAHRTPEEMIRFVLDPEGNVIPDLKRKLPGRGVWVTATRGYVAEAVKRSVFAKGFRRPVVVNPDLPEIIEKSLEKDLVQSLSLANKAGMVAAGTFQVEKALANDDISVLIQAADGSRDGVRKIRHLATRTALEPESLEILDFLDSEQIGLALGRASVVHAALRRGPVTQALMARARRLASFRGLGAGKEASGSPDSNEIDPMGSENGQRPGIEN